MVFTLLTGTRQLVVVQLIAIVAPVVYVHKKIDYCEATLLPHSTLPSLLLLRACARAREGKGGRPGVVEGDKQGKRSLPTVRALLHSVEICNPSI